MFVFFTVSAESWAGHNRSSHLYNGISVLSARGGSILQLFPLLASGKASCFIMNKCDDSIFNVPLLKQLSASIKL